MNINTIINRKSGQIIEKMNYNKKTRGTRMFIGLIANLDHLREDYGLDTRRPSISDRAVQSIELGVSDIGKYSEKLIPVYR